jgi:hypothetical protein
VEALLRILPRMDSISKEITLCAITTNVGSTSMLHQKYTNGSKLPMTQSCDRELRTFYSFHDVAW